jgi:methionyl-tRNA synthetase
VGYSLRAPELLFRKVEDEEVQYQVEKLKKGLEKSKMEQKTKETGAAAAEDSQPAEIKPEIQYDDFAKLDLRIGTITAAEKVAKADKLLKLAVDLGSETRTIVSGIAQHFTPESLVQKQVIVVANLAPRKMRGIESQGMILTAEQPDGSLILVNPDAVTVNGSGVR